MKKASVVIMALLLTGSMARLFPCDVTMETKPAKERGQIEVRLFVDCIHRFCPLAIENTELKAEGLVIVKQGEWKNVEGNLYEIDLLVKLNGNKKGKIHVTRSCPKRGTQQETVEIARP